MSIVIGVMTSHEKIYMADFLYHAVFIPLGMETPSRDVICKPDIHIYIDGFGSKKGDCGVVTEKDGYIVGAAWTRIIPAYGYVDDKTPELAMSVLPEYRGQGIGTKMLSYLFDLLREDGFKQTSLSVQKANPAAKLYQRMGYKIIRENEEDYIMVKELGIKLRGWNMEDAPDLASAINNKHVLDNLRDGIPYPYSEKDAAEFISATLTAEKDSQYAFAITYDGKVIGSIGVFRKENVHRLTAELGYYIAEPYWGKGVMTEAVKQICATIFESTDIIRIFAEPYAFNHASCRVLEKAGFQFEGTLRQNAVKNGQLVNMKMYAILKPPAIRRLEKDDIIPAMDMVWKVFLEFIAPDYMKEGIDEFKAFINPALITDKMARGEFHIWGVFAGERIIGVIALKPPHNIALFSVDKQYHNQGIGRKLFQAVLGDKTATQGWEKIAVNASPYAVKIYRRLGFVPTDTERTANGMRFTPMELKLKI
jgi:RimJ/RimL family protein N-acetyltransferase